MESDCATVPMLLRSSNAPMPSIDPPLAHARTLLRDAGPCESAVFADHGLSLHTGTPVWGECRDGPVPRRYLRTPGGINFVPAGGTSRWMIEGRMAAVYVHIPKLLLASVAADLERHRALDQLVMQHQVRDHALERLSLVLNTELSAAPTPDPLFIESLSTAICTRLLSRFASCPPPPQTRVRHGFAPQGLTRVTQYVEAHLGDEHLSLRVLAAEAGTSLSYLKAAFKQAMGVSLHRYIVERRVERAAMLLAQGRHSISAVAAEVGFAHASHLARWTRRLLQATPASLKANRPA
jgi:AraC family transcriptional regulator